MAAPAKLLKVRLAAASTPLEHIAALNRAQDNIGAVLDPLALNVGKTPIMGAAAPAWIRPVLVSDFADRQGLGSNAFTAFHKDALGYVWVRLALGTNGGKNLFDPIFQFPPGYRLLAPWNFVGHNASTATVTFFQLQADGTLVTLTTIGATNVVEARFSFLAEQ